MNGNIRFAIASDLHIGLPQTIWDSPKRFHLVEVSIPALEIVLEHLEQLDLDFLLLPGDLTQHGEPENHQWLQKRLQSLSFPVYVIPGNHDVPNLLPTEKSIGFQDFPKYYRQFGYQDVQKLYYSLEILPGVQLIALNSNQFDHDGNQLGCLDKRQLEWLEENLQVLQQQNLLVLVMIHHNVIEHIPGQSSHELGKRYMLDNATELLAILRKYGIKSIFSGHLHVQDVVEAEGIYEITTGSLVSYPHPYRVIEIGTDTGGKRQLKIESYRVKTVPGWDNLAEISRERMADRSYPFMFKLLTSPPLNLPVAKAQQLAPQLRYFWADIAAGDTLFDFTHFPPKVSSYFQKFGAISADGTPAQIDNQTILSI